MKTVKVTKDFCDYFNQFCKVEGNIQIQNIDKNKQKLYINVPFIDGTQENMSINRLNLEFDYEYDSWGDGLYLKNCPDFLNTKTDQFKMLAEYVFDSYEFERVDNETLEYI